jgi:hypothetical protein
MGGARLRAMGAALSAAVLAAVILSAGASATSSKPYSIVICGNDSTGCISENPAVIAAGGTPSVSVTFKNDNKLGSGIQLGSDNLTVPNPPAGFSVVGTSLKPCPASLNNLTPPCFYLLNGGATVGFRQLNLAPGQSVSINISVVTPAPSATACTTATPCFWSDEAKQANDFSGNGNDLNSDSNSLYSTVTSSAASCPKNHGCATQFGDGGTASSAQGSISTTITTSSGKTAVTQIQSIDFGAPLDPGKCSGVSSPHLTYLNLSGGSNNGSDRSQTITIVTTDFPGYSAEGCFETAAPFTQLVIDPTTGAESLAPASGTKMPDGTIGPPFQGLLPDCGNQTLQVNCNKNPGVVLRQTAPDGKTHTLQVQVPPGFDSRIGN